MVSHNVSPVLLGILRQTQCHNQPHLGMRTNVEIGNTQGVLDGDLDEFISASLKQGV